MIHWAINIGYKYARYEDQVKDPLQRRRMVNQIQMWIMTAMGCFDEESDHPQIWMEEKPRRPI